MARKKTFPPRQVVKPAPPARPPQPSPAVSKGLLSRVWVQAVTLVALTLAAYWPSLPGDFVWDDQKMIPMNPLIVGDDGLARIWSPSTQQADYWPLAYTTHWLEWRVWGQRTAGYRTLNVLLHAANALLLWRIAALLGVPAAWWCGAAFALHPVNVEAVVWILQRKTTLSTLLYLAAALAWLRYLDRRRWPLLAAAWLAFLFALLTKTSVVMLPVALLVIAWLKQGRLERRDLWATAPLFALALVMGLVGVYYQRYGAGADETVRGDGLASRTAIAGRAVWFYLSKALWPRELCFVYPRWPTDVLRLETFLPALGVAAATAGLALWRWKSAAQLATAALAAWLFYLVNLFPALGFSNIYFMRYSLVADHWQYTALLGLTPLAVGLAGAWLQRSARESPLLAAAPGVLLLALLGANTFAYATVFSGHNEQIWRDTLAKNPTASLAEHNLGLILFERGEYSTALAHFQRAAELEPSDAEIRANLAKAMAMGQNEIGEVIAQHRRAVEQAPNHPQYRGDLAAVLVGSYFAELSPQQFGRLLERAGYANCQELLADAERQLQPALAMRSPLPSVLNNLGLLHLAHGRLDQAAAAFRRSLAANPSSGRAHGNLAGVLAQQGRGAEALAEYDAALRLDPAALEFVERLAWFLATYPDDSLRDGERAVRMAQTVCQASRRQVRKHLLTLAAAYAQANQFDDAVAAQREALELPAATAGCRVAATPDDYSPQACLEKYQQQQPLRPPLEIWRRLW